MEHTAERFQNTPGLPRQALEEIGDLHGSPGCGLVLAPRARRPSGRAARRGQGREHARQPVRGLRTSARFQASDRLLHA